jgi:magnesium transporter
VIHVFHRSDNVIISSEPGLGDPLPSGLLWCDLFEPTAEERRKIETAFGILLPSAEEMREIEPSARLYAEGEALYMTATILWRSDEPLPAADPITFILHPSALVTLRYANPRPVAYFSEALIRGRVSCHRPDEALIGLLDRFVARFADVLERVSIELDRLSRSIFDPDGPNRGGGSRDLQGVLKALGREEDLTSTARESLLSIARLVRFLLPQLEVGTWAPTREIKNKIKSLRIDIESLSEHAAFETAKVGFMLNATLGMINVEQNRIIKLFSVVAVAFLPPTLIASIYGMNFEFMPELAWPIAYPLALLLMVASAALPFWYFRRKGWL